MTSEAVSPSHPIQLTLDDDLERNRVTVFFRLILAIPHIIWLSLWGIVVYFAIIGNWFATLLGGRSPEGLHNFMARYLTYMTHVRAYLFFLSDPYPGFMGDDAYPTEITIAPAADQNRWITGFRIILGIPALIVAGVLSYVAQVLAFFAWIVNGRIPLIGRTLPSSDNSPAIAHFSRAASFSRPFRSSSKDANPRAIGRSKLGPSFRISAGARLIVMGLSGHLRPLLTIAVVTRSTLSRTAASGSPTSRISSFPPLAASTSISTPTASTP